MVSGVCREACSEEAICVVERCCGEVFAVGDGQSREIRFAAMWCGLCRSATPGTVPGRKQGLQQCTSLAASRRPAHRESEGWGHRALSTPSSVVPLRRTSSS